MELSLLAALFGLAVSQAALYQIPTKQALQHFWFLGFFYFFLFAFSQGIVIFSRLFSLPFCEFPLFFLAVFILFRRTGKPFPQFGKQVRPAPDFYLFSAVWAGGVWLAFIFSSGGFQTHPYVPSTGLNAQNLGKGEACFATGSGASSAVPSAAAWPPG